MLWHRFQLSTNPQKKMKTRDRELQIPAFRRFWRHNICSNEQIFRRQNLSSIDQIKAFFNHRALAMDHRHLRIYRLVNGTYCLPCLLHYYCKWPLQQKKEAYPWKAGASSKHTTNLKQSILRLSISLQWILDIK